MVRSTSFPFSRTLVLAAAAFAAMPAAASSQMPGDPGLQEAYLAWQKGDYPAALRGYLDVLNGPRGAGHVREIAALTGEVFQVTEIAPDGQDLVMGPDGRRVAWQTAAGDGSPSIHVAELPDGRRVATVEGTSPALSSTGRLAYFTTRRSPELAEAVRAMDRARAAGDRSAYFEALARARWLEASGRRLHVRELDGGVEVVVESGDWVLGDAVWAPGTEDLYVVAGRPGEAERNDLLRIDGEGRVTVLETGPGFKADPVPVPARGLLVWTAPSGRPVPLAPGTAGGTPDRTGVGVLELATGRRAFLEGARDPAVAADGSRIAWLGQREGLSTVESVELAMDVLMDHAGPALVATGMELANPAVSPDGRWVAYQKRPVHDWEIFAVPTSGAAASGTGAGEVQLTKEIQHDLFPVFLDATTVLAAKGEGRHRRSFLYDIEAVAGSDAGGGSGGVVKLFHNNTVRTIAPEYEWAPTPDGSAVVIVSERDGDTVSPERGVYAVHLDRPVTEADVRERLESNLAAELDLRARGRAMFRDIEGRVRRVTERVDVGRIYEYAKVLYTFDSKYITRPGNRMASDYIVAKLRSWGYEPELQWFEPRPGLRTANVIARLPGTTDPELVYVVSSHYDSVERGPGADDNSSGTTALLEAARVMKDHPQPATIEFAFFTGEEAGLLGSREYVRRAVASGKRIVGALNNDMVGWSNGPRLDNTIRYSNAGIRDVQHNAAMLFSDLITYDALYYKSTDAHAYYEEYGDIVGGIGSYPVLGNPHYHQFTDRLNTINQRLVAEVSRTTVATLMLLASSPARVTGLQARRAPGGFRLVWDGSPESAVAGYVVEWADADGRAHSERVERPEHTVRGVAPGSAVRVKAVNGAGMLSWDWARVNLPG